VDELHVSGAVVTALPGRFDDARAALAAIAGVDVHQTDAATRRLVITIESATVDEARSTLVAIQGLAPVAHAHLVVHRTG